MKHLKHKFKDNKIIYEVAGGDFSTNKDVKVRFSLPECKDGKIITHKFQLLISSKLTSQKMMVLVMMLSATVGVCTQTSLDCKW